MLIQPSAFHAPGRPNKFYRTVLIKNSHKIPGRVTLFIASFTEEFTMPVILSSEPFFFTSEHVPDVPHATIPIPKSDTCPMDPIIPIIPLVENCTVRIEFLSYPIFYKFNGKEYPCFLPLWMLPWNTLTPPSENTETFSPWICPSKN